MQKINIKQGSAEWHFLRRTHLTGTMLKGVMSSGKTRQNALFEFIANRLTIDLPEDEEYENPQNRGLRLEKPAREAFEQLTGKHVELVGFIKHDTIQNLAYSPDGVISDTEDLEIKCCLGPNYVKVWLTNEPLDEWKWQIIHAFTVNPLLQKRYLVSYNPNIPVYPMHIIEINRKDLEEEIKEVEVKQQEFLNEANEQLLKILNIN